MESPNYTVSSDPQRLDVDAIHAYLARSYWAKGIPRAIVEKSLLLETHQGQGLARRLMEAVCAHPELQGVRRFVLVTTSATDLYRKFGFEPVPEKSGYMQKRTS
jgi:GNAT superfamily N-acetyltransferase